jgi:hypothetical protein
MKFLRHLAKVELVAIASLATVAMAVAAYAAIFMSLHPSPEFSAADAVEAVFFYLFPAGCFAVALVVAPVYAALLKKGLATWLVALVVGASPGAAVLLFSYFFGLLSLASGAVVGLATHAICASGSNHSSKRTRVPRAA